MGKKRKLKRRKLRRIGRTRRATKKTKITKIPPVLKKKLRNERFFPSFSARDTFCTSKFRQARMTQQVKTDFKS